ncbi:long-chain fatty acid transport protein 4-like [Tribolium madens]|uniref:long-chain fatty acid transport protein 4-like n=1 Tax=Tribolium madens TaxID=41895 RepID=UPI001CF7464A|nr:long-chain fatty acid transport protein 4-like [Tribolium madens]
MAYGILANGQNQHLWLIIEQVKYRKIDFSATGVFRIDYGMVFSIYGAVISAGLRFSTLNFQLWRYEKTQQTVAKIFTKLASKHPQKVAFYFENEIWTFEDVDKYSNKIGNFFKNQGFKRGDAVALVLESRPEYVTIWLGLAKIGVVTALINSNLVADPLAHSIQVADAKAVIYGSDFAKAISDISGKILKIRLYQFAKNGGELLPNSVDLAKEVEKEGNGPLTSDIAKGRPRDKLLFIFTSGTTGLPKAAVIPNTRFIFMALGIRYMAVISENDIIYDPLPLYHSAGTIVGVGQCILKGTTVVIRKKFSASYFWVDCIKYRCTKEGFNLDKIEDKLFLYDAKNVDYVELTKEKYHDIMTGKIRL